MRNIQIDLFLFLFDGIIHVAKTLYKLTNLLQLLRILEYQLHGGVNILSGTANIITEKYLILIIRYN